MFVILVSFSYINSDVTLKFEKTQSFLWCGPSVTFRISVRSDLRGLEKTRVKDGPNPDQ